MAQPWLCIGFSNIGLNSFSVFRSIFFLRLRVLKQQKQVLQTWLQEGIDSSTPSASLDFGSVETEMQQVFICDLV